MSERETTCVIGGESFAARSAVSALRARGRPVRVVLTDAGPAGSPIERWYEALAGVEVVRGSVSTPEGALRAVEGARAVVYAPGVLAELRSAKTWEQRCVVATEELLDASRARGVRRFVYVSSELVTLGGEPRKYVEDTYVTPVEPAGAFVHALALGEDLVIAAQGPRIETVALRPGYLWGPGETTNARRWVTRARSGGFSWVGDGASLWPSTSGPALGDAVLGALEADPALAGGTAYYVTDDERVTVRAFFTRWFASMGVRGPRGRVPSWVAQASAWWSARAEESRDREPSAPWTREEALSLAHGGHFNLKRAREELSWRAERAAETGSYRDAPARDLRSDPRWAPVGTLDEGMRALSAWVAAKGGADKVLGPEALLEEPRGRVVEASAPIEWAAGEAKPDEANPTGEGA